MQYSLFPDDNALDEEKESSLEQIREYYANKMHGLYDSPYGPIVLDHATQLDLQRGALGALHAGANKLWSHPVKLMNGSIVELSAPVMLLTFNYINDHLNCLKRELANVETAIVNARSKEELRFILTGKVINGTVQDQRS